MLQRIDGAYVVTHPLDLPEVIAAMPICSAAGYKREYPALITHIEHAATKVVVVVFQPYEVRFFHLVSVGVDKGLQAVFLESAVCFVLVVVTVALGVVQRGI